MKKKTRKLLSLFLAFTILLGTFTIGIGNIQAEAATIVSQGNACDSYTDSSICNGKHLTYTFYSDGKFVISGTGEMHTGPEGWWYSRKEGGIFPPWLRTDDKESQKAIMDGVRTIVIGEGVTSIADYAFANYGILETISLPESLVSIGECAFLGDCEWNEYILSYGNNLKTVHIPKNVSKIGRMAFSQCADLTKFTVDPNNKFFTSDSAGVLYSKDKKTLIQYPLANKQTSYNIPNGVTTIGLEAFYGSALSAISIPDSVTTIEDMALNDCYNLSSITVGSANKKYSNDEYGVLFNKNKTDLMLYPKKHLASSYVIPNTVTSIDVEEFYNCDNLKSITIPDSITSIGEYAFGECDNLTNVIISDTVTSIEDAAFIFCGSLSDIYYTGTESEWNKIKIGGWNDDLTNATIHYNYKIETGTLKFDETYSFANNSENFSTKSNSTYYISDSDFQKLSNYARSLYSNSDTIINDLQSARNEEWCGSCYGMAVTTVLDKTGQIAMNENFDSDAKTLHDVDIPNKNDDVKSAINYYHISQNGLIERNLQYKEDTPKWAASLKSIVSEAKNGKMILFSYWWIEYNSEEKIYEEYGHTIVIKGYKQDTNGDHCLIAYDNRYPDEDFIIRIDPTYISCITQNNEEAFIIAYKTNFDIYDRIDIDGPYNDMEINYSASPKKNDGTKIRFKASGTVTIVNASGETLTYKDGKTSGTMSVISKDMSVNSTNEGSPDIADIILTVPDSDMFTIKTANENYDVSILSNDIYANAYAENADSVEISKNDGIHIVGDNLGKCEAYLGINDENFDMVSVESDGGKNIAISCGNNGVLVTGADGGNSSITVFENTVDTTNYSYKSGYSKVLVTKNNEKTDILASSKDNSDFDTSILDSDSDTSLFGAILTLFMSFFELLLLPFTFLFAILF